MKMRKKEGRKEARDATILESLAFNVVVILSLKCLLLTFIVAIINFMTNFTKII